MKKPNRLNLIVSIPAFNEEANVANVLKSLLSQSHKNYNLKKITVYSDGSTDSTVEIVKKMAIKYPVIRIVDGGRRCGKNFRLNQIFREAQGDVVVVLDADIGIVGRDFLDNLVKTFLDDKEAKMVVAHQRLLRPNNFFGKVFYTSYLNWDFVRLSVPDCDHVQNFYGAATAYKTSFAKTLQIPEGLKEERLYIYLMAKKFKGFRYTYDSEIVYWPVSTLADFMKLSRRSFGMGEKKLDRMFKLDTSQVHIIDKKYRVKGLIRAFINDPIYTPIAMAFNLFISKFRPKNKIIKSSLWEITPSSKKVITT